MKSRGSPSVASGTSRYGQRLDVGAGQEGAAVQVGTWGYAATARASTSRVRVHYEWSIVFRLASEYRPPATASGGTAASSSLTSAGDNFTAIAARFSSRYFRRLVPGNGDHVFALRHTNASASCSTVTPFLSAMTFNYSTSRRFLSNAPLANLGQTVARETVPSRSLVKKRRPR